MSITNFSAVVPPYHPALNQNIGDKTRMSSDQKARSERIKAVACASLVASPVILSAIDKIISWIRRKITKEMSYNDLIELNLYVKRLIDHTKSLSASLQCYPVQVSAQNQLRLDALERSLVGFLAIVEDEIKRLNMYRMLLPDSVQPLQKQRYIDQLIVIEKMFQDVQSSLHRYAQSIPLIRNPDDMLALGFPLIADTKSQYVNFPIGTVFHRVTGGMSGFTLGSLCSVCQAHGSKKHINCGEY